jgi:subtilisin family serine protease
MGAFLSINSKISALLVCFLMASPGLLMAAKPGFSVAAQSSTSSNQGKKPQLTRKQAAREQVPRYAPDRVLVKFKPGSAAGEHRKAHNNAGGKKLHEISAIGVHVVQVPKGTVQDKIARYSANPNVEFVEPDYYRLLVIPDEGNDPGPDNGGVIAGREYFEEQWGLNNTGQQHTSFEPLFGTPIQVNGSVDADIDAPEAWDITTGDTAVKIGILDSGVDCNSIEHIGKCVEEISFVSDYSETLDDIAQHGTHVAGIAAVHTNNGIGIAGTGWNSSIGNLKTCFEYDLDLLPPLGYYVTVGVCPVSASANAITHAADNGYHVINMSYGSDELDADGNPDGVPTRPNAETAAISYAWSQGVVLVGAAGNDGVKARTYPAAYPEVIAVGATNHFDNLASFSNFSSPDDYWVTLLAPGEDILSTIPVYECIFLAEEILGIPFNPFTEGCMTWNSGTSMASPHVSGTAALVWAHHFPGQSPQGCSSPSGVPCNEVVRMHLEYGADETGADTQDMLAWSEFGRLNMYGALTVIDTDLDGLPNGVDTDDDDDGLDDSLESILGTDPLDADSDDDGLDDGTEVNYSTSPPDTYIIGLDTDPLNNDTDADGFQDGMEVDLGHDPLDDSDSPVWGDTDGNGIVNAADILKLTRALLDLETLSTTEMARVDIAPVIAGVPTPDGKITVGDLTVVQQILLGITTYP